MSQVTVADPDETPAANAAQAPRLELSRVQMNVVFVTILLGLLLSALDQTIVSTALPTIVGDLGGAGHVSWVVTAYMLAETVSTVLAGKFGDLFGRKRVFQLGVAVFIVGSFFCGLANSMVLLIAFRAVQGLGGGALTVTSTALIADVIPLRLRGQYQGALGAVFGVTTVIGPLLGGVFTDNLSWRWVFYVNVPIAVIVIALAARTIPQIRSGRKPVIDYLGIVFVALGATGLTLATSWGGTQYAWGSATIIGLFAASVAALAIFVWVELRAAEPILPMRLFRSRVFTVCSVLSFIVGFAMIGSITFMPTFLQYVNGVSATASGLRMLPMVIGAAGHRAGQRHDREPDRRLPAVPDRRVRGHRGGPVPAVPDGRPHQRLGGVAVPAGARGRHRADHADPDAGGAEHCGLLRPGHGHLGGDLLPHPRRLVRRLDHGQHLRQRAAGAAARRSRRVRPR